ncbi:hypothetical protein J1N35_013946 [Gossypium stocksii]|uniref:Uncharacterized protein n=1 Tax=Gossypium stocksii TaxID=47602 RepID=A0A9D4A8E5_9ROSI|nr:hypothetical protein J1N35_013946 [Gossypium stocksii]
MKRNVVCKLCGNVVKGGITRFKEYISHKTGNVAPCPNVTEVGQGVKPPTPYEVLDVYLESEYQRVRDWVNGLNTHWKELGATLTYDEIGKKPSVAKVSDEAKKVTCFIYNHIWTVDLMTKYTQDNQILQPALTLYKDGERLTVADEEAVVEMLLHYHPHSEDKIGCGLDSIMLSQIVLEKNLLLAFLLRSIDILNLDRQDVSFLLELMVDG